MNCGRCGLPISTGSLCPACERLLSTFPQRTPQPSPHDRAVAGWLWFVIAGVVVVVFLAMGLGSSSDSGSPWNVTSSPDPMNDATQRQIVQSPSNEPPLWIDCGTRPSIGFGELKGFTTDTLVGGLPAQAVEIRFGKESATTELWLVTQSDTGIVTPAYRHIIAGMARNGSFAIRYTRDGFREYATFQTADLRQVLSRYPECAALLKAWPSSPLK